MNIDPPSVECKQQKKISPPTFDPQNMSWQNFSMKLHVAPFDQDMDYLLTETSTIGYNYVHSKELMVELYKKTKGKCIRFILFSKCTTLLPVGWSWNRND
jgi:hypothetical protein